MFKTLLVFMVLIAGSVCVLRCYNFMGPRSELSSVREKCYYGDCYVMLSKDFVIAGCDSVGCDSLHSDALDEAKFKVEARAAGKSPELTRKECCSGWLCNGWGQINKKDCKKEKRESKDSDEKDTEKEHFSRLGNETKSPTSLSSRLPPL